MASLVTGAKSGAEQMFAFGDQFVFVRTMNGLEAQEMNVVISRNTTFSVVQFMQLFKDWTCPTFVADRAIITSFEVIDVMEMNKTVPKRKIEHKRTLFTNIAIALQPLYLITSANALRTSFCCLKDETWKKCYLAVSLSTHMIVDDESRSILPSMHDGV